jgi:hypothetical protein
MVALGLNLVLIEISRWASKPYSRKSWRHIMDAWRIMSLARLSRKRTPTVLMKLNLQRGGGRFFCDEIDPMT